MNVEINKSYALAADFNVKLRYAIFATSAILVLILGFYIYYVQASVVNLVARNQANIELVNISAEIAPSEKNYISASSALTLKVAVESGFEEKAVSRFVREGRNPGLSLLPQ